MSGCMFSGSFHTNETPRKLTVSKKMKGISSASEPDLSDVEELNKKLNGDWTTSLNELKRGDTRVVNIGDFARAQRDVLLQPRKKAVTKRETRALESTDKHIAVASGKTKFQVLCNKFYGLKSTKQDLNRQQASCDINSPLCVL